MIEPLTRRPSTANPYQAFRLPDEPTAAPPRTEQLIAAAELRRRGELELAAASGTVRIAIGLVVVSIVVSLASTLWMRPGSLLIVWGPALVACRRLERAKMSRRRGRFFLDTASRWDAGPGIDGRPISFAAVSAEFDRRVGGPVREQTPSRLFTGVLVVLAALLVVVMIVAVAG